MSSNENFDKILSVIICQDNGASINFAFHFSVDEKTAMAVLNALHQHLTNLLDKAKSNEEKSH